MSAVGIVAGTIYAYIAAVCYVSFETPAKGGKQTKMQDATRELDVWLSKAISAAASFAWPVTLTASLFILRGREKQIDAMLATLRAIDEFVDDVLIPECARVTDTGWIGLRTTLRDHARCILAVLTDEDDKAIANAQRHLDYYEAFVWLQCSYLIVALLVRGETFDMKKLPACLARHQRTR